MAKNITLKLADTILNETKQFAAKDDESISAWVSKLIENEILRRKGFLKSKKHALNILNKGVKLNSKKLLRENLYD
jgi:hypothetical protein